MTTKAATYLFGIVFILVGILGFTDNGIISDSEDAIFHADKVHSTVHLVTGISFLAFAMMFPLYTTKFLSVFGILYLVIGVLGLISIGVNGMTTVLGFLHVNGADNILHVTLGILIFLAGFGLPRFKDIA